MTAVREYTLYLTGLCRHAINGSVPDGGIPEGIDPEKLLDFCQAHMLTGLAYDVLQRTDTGYDDTMTMLIFKDKYNHALTRDAAQSHYLDLIRDAFEENGIDFLVLKGMVMKNIYPASFFRQSSDIDILIRTEDAEKAKNVMEELGFETEVFGAEDHTDNYKADKYSYVELHKSLIPAVYKDFAECNRIPERAISIGGHEYVMSDEDFYLFMVTHIAKHMKYSSVGIRSVLDVWVYLREYTALDFDYLNRKLEECKLTAFYSNLMKLIGFWFEGKEPDRKTLIMSDYIGMSGWNGNSEQVEAYDLDRFGGADHSELYIRSKNLMKAAFAGTDIMKVRYPVLEKHSYLLPVCWAHRWFSVLFTRKDQIGSVLHEYDYIDKKQASDIRSLRKSFGL